MGLKDIVAGLELSPVLGKYGVYLRCDTCGAMLDGARINVGTEAERIGADEIELAARARSLGWTGPLSRGGEGDACPSCSRATSHFPDWTDGGRLVELTLEDGRVVVGQLDLEEFPLPDGDQEMVSTISTPQGETLHLLAAKSWRFLP